MSRPWTSASGETSPRPLSAYPQSWPVHTRIYRPSPTSKHEGNIHSTIRRHLSQPSKSLPFRSQNTFHTPPSQHHPYPDSSRSQTPQNASGNPTVRISSARDKAPRPRVVQRVDTDRQDGSILVVVGEDARVGEKGDSDIDIGTCKGDLRLRVTQTENGCLQMGLNRTMLAKRHYCTD